jgi:hypothetical protein
MHAAHLDELVFFSFSRVLFSDTRLDWEFLVEGVHEVIMLDYQWTKGNRKGEST